MSPPNLSCVSFTFSLTPVNHKPTLLQHPDTQPEALLRVLRSQSENEQSRGFSTIRSLAEAATSEIARYAEELEKVDQKLKRLREEVARGKASAGHRELVATLDKTRQDMADDHKRLCYLSAVAISIDAPVRRLPTEILASIFQFCRDNDRSRVGVVGPQQELDYLAGGTLVPASQVCSRWRDVVHGTPALWSDVELHIHLWTEERLSRRRVDRRRAYDHAQRLLGIALTRAATMPLTLRVVGGGKCLPDILHTLTNEAHRWRSVSFSLDAEMLRDALPAQLAAPLLESLQLEVLTEGRRGEHLCNAFACFHRTRPSCKFSISAPAASLAHLPLPLERIAAFTYTKVGWEELPRVLRQMEDLPIGAAVHMEIDFTDLWNWNHEEGKIKLPDVVSRIGRLDISSESSSNGSYEDTQIALAAIFRHVSLPDLKSFRVFGENVRTVKRQPVYWPIPEIVQGPYFFPGIHSTIQHLSLYDAHVQDDMLLTILKSLPGLTRLSLSDNTDSYDFLFEALTRTDEESAHALVPSLRRLDLRSCGDFEMPSLSNLLQSRAASASSKFVCLLLGYPGRVFRFESETEEPFTLIAIAGLVELLAGKLQFVCRDFEEEDYELEF